MRSDGGDPTDEFVTGRHSRGRSVGLNVCIRADVLHRVVEEIIDNPSVEVGGKFVGFVEGPLRRGDSGWKAALTTTTVHIEAYIDPGPGSDRSATHHHSDLDYQQAIFERLSRRFTGLQFVGLWHSHHPNGLGTLSGGDVNTGMSIVNSPHHEMDFLISSLATDRRGLHAASHHAFVRGQEGYRDVEARSVRTVPGRSEVADVLDSWRRPRDSGDRTDGPPAWVSTPEGRAIITTDRNWLRAAYPEMQPVLNGGRLLWRGIVRHCGLDFECAYVYAAEGPGHPGTISVTTTDGSAVRSSAQVDPQHREEQFRLLVSNVYALSRKLTGRRSRTEGAGPVEDVLTSAPLT